MEELYIYKDNKKLRCGYTTGSCAAAAAKAAAIGLLLQKDARRVTIDTPKGIVLTLDIITTEHNRTDYRKKPLSELDDKQFFTETVSSVTCSVKKDGGDDADITHGVLVYATVSKTDREITIDGGLGIGRVTRTGLDQPVGEAAINRVPRQMIEKEVKEICEEADYKGGLRVIIEIPEGERLAEKTFNPRLGITGGISILGTSGIVEPMSEKALVDTIRTEIRMLSAKGVTTLAVVPGNYGEAFAGSELNFGEENMVKCSNFIGDTIDMAYEFRLKGFLLIGHIGKLVKLGAGIMNTHSKWGDARQEILCSCALKAGCDTDVLSKILDCVTTEEALAVLKEQGKMEAAIDILMVKIEYYLKKRAYDGLTIGAVLFSNKFGLLGKTTDAERLMKQLR
ncbi:cobalt-precorrin-5B (C(1))-methyltransferase CbiD [Anaerocolumna sp. AGMB13020]|uniref:cobalt-precorrin-5B (C(1))-methyltransferase CbiD n=1 Tax=Anaerocolumna sp. AGMB13020 TaxID=3081750 RepID=UPI0029535152|nr:cobalt-precorrin-5B (C(1))-methyltransferase CbiD [Anaerocolumna sp. AGMB13020]WOO38625.1 cobalt-precorrin-5B (C(1))-methyltransferase CbiD [Anaerocolumna sp. AGMB13020]